MEAQSLYARYVDLQKLVRLLTNAFGTGNFEIDAQVRAKFVIQQNFQTKTSYKAKSRMEATESFCQCPGNSRR
jgi:hypothetical protein